MRMFTCLLAFVIPILVVAQAPNTSQQNINNLANPRTRVFVNAVDLLPRREYPQARPRNTLTDQQPSRQPLQRDPQRLRETFQQQPQGIGNPIHQPIQQLNEQSQQISEQPQQFNEQPQQFNTQSQQFSEQPQQFNEQQFNTQSRQFTGQPRQVNEQIPLFNEQPQQFNTQPKQFTGQPRQVNEQIPPFNEQPQQFNEQSQIMIRRQSQQYEQPPRQPVHFYREGTVRPQQVSPQFNGLFNQQQRQVQPIQLPLSSQQIVGQQRLSQQSIPEATVLAKRRYSPRTLNSDQTRQMTQQNGISSTQQKGVANTDFQIQPENFVSQTIYSRTETPRYLEAQPSGSSRNIGPVRQIPVRIPQTSLARVYVRNIGVSSSHTPSIVVTEAPENAQGAQIDRVPPSSFTTQNQNYQLPPARNLTQLSSLSLLRQRTSPSRQGTPLSRQRAPHLPASRAYATRPQAALGQDLASARQYNITSSGMNPNSMLTGLPKEPTRNTALDQSSTRRSAINLRRKELRESFWLRRTPKISALVRQQTAVNSSKPNLQNSTKQDKMFHVRRLQPGFQKLQQSTKSFQQKQTPVYQPILNNNNDIMNKPVSRGNATNSNNNNVVSSRNPANNNNNNVVSSRNPANNNNNNVVSSRNAANNNYNNPAYSRNPANNNNNNMVYSRNAANNNLVSGGKHVKDKNKNPAKTTNKNSPTQAQPRTPTSFPAQTRRSDAINPIFAQSILSRQEPVNMNRGVSRLVPECGPRDQPGVCCPSLASCGDRFLLDDETGVCPWKSGSALGVCCVPHVCKGNTFTALGG